MVNAEILNSHPLSTLKKEISKTNIKGYSRMKKPELVATMMKHKERFGHIKHSGKTARVAKAPAKEPEKKKYKFTVKEKKPATPKAPTPKAKTPTPKAATPAKDGGLIGSLIATFNKKVHGRAYRATYKKIVGRKGDKLLLESSDRFGQVGKVDNKSGMDEVEKGSKPSKSSITTEDLLVKLESSLTTRKFEPSSHAIVEMFRPQKLSDDKVIILKRGQKDAGSDFTDEILNVLNPPKLKPKDWNPKMLPHLIEFYDNESDFDRREFRFKTKEQEEYFSKVVSPFVKAARRTGVVLHTKKAELVKIINHLNKSYNIDLNKASEFYFG